MLLGLSERYQYASGKNLNKQCFIFLALPVLFPISEALIATMDFLAQFPLSMLLLANILSCI